MPDENFTVKAVDRQGQVLMDGTVQTLPNGFFELWLPRNRKIELTVERRGLKATGLIETFADSPTCITTFHLQ